VGAGPEIQEGPEGSPPIVLELGTTGNGRIGVPREVDRYRVAVQPGDRVRVDVQAPALGSWLDPVVTFLDARGNTIVEGDHRKATDPGARALALAQGSPDLRLEAEAPTVGPLVVAITDRFGAGGPAYAYRLTVGPPRPDFTLRVTTRSAPWGGSGALNLAPGARVPLPFQVVTQGRPGPIMVRAEGLPPGVTAGPVSVRIPPPAPGDPPSTSIEGTLILEVDPGAARAIGRLRIVATARVAEGVALTRRGALGVVLASMAPGDPRPAPTRVVTEFPVMVVGTHLR
jgi:hypothetical protein